MSTFSDLLKADDEARAKVATVPAPTEKPPEAKAPAVPTASTPVAQRTTPKPKAPPAPKAPTEPVSTDVADWPMPGTQEFEQASPTVQKRTMLAWNQLTPKQQETARKLSAPKVAATPSTGLDDAKKLLDAAGQQGPMSRVGVTGESPYKEVIQTATKLLQPTLVREVAPLIPFSEDARKEVISNVDQSVKRYFDAQKSEVPSGPSAPEKKREIAEEDPNLAAALEVADKLRYSDPFKLNKKFIDIRATDLANREVERQGPEVMTNGPAFAKIQKDAADKAVAELVNLRKRGQWDFDVTAEDLTGQEPTLRSKFAPKRTVSSTGDIQTESIASWAMGVPLSSVDYAVTTWVQGMDPKESRGVPERFIENLAGRKDVVTSRIEGDPELQAALTSGDGDKIDGAVMTLVPYILLMLATPDPVTAVLAPVKAAATAARAAKYAAKIKGVLKEGGKVQDIVKIVDNIHKAEVAEQTATKATSGVLKVVDAYRDSGNAEQALEGVSQETQRVVRNDIAQNLQADPEVAAYLAATGQSSGPVDPAKMPSLPDVDEARLTEVTERIAELRKAAAEAPDYATKAPLDNEIKRLAAEKKELDALAIAKAGEAKFADFYTKAADQAMEDLEEAATGGVAPARRASDFKDPDPPPLVKDEAAVRDAFGEAVDARTARKIADAKNPEELVRALNAAPDGVKNFVAQKLGFKDFSDLHTRVTGTPRSATVDKTRQVVKDLEAAATEARRVVDEGLTPPDVDQLFTDAEAAQAALDNTKKMSKSSRVARQAAVDKMFEKAKAAEYKSLQAAEKQATEAEKALSAARKKLDKQEKILASMGAEHAVVQTAMDAQRAAFKTPADNLAAVEAAEAAALKTTRAAPMNDPLVSAGRDRTQLVNELLFYKKGQPAPWRQFFDNIGDFVANNLWHPWHEVEERSLTDAARTIRRQFEGEVQVLGARLARAVAAAKTDTDAVNLVALAAITEEIPYFKQAVRARQVPSEFYGVVVTAYLRPDVKLTPDRAKVLTGIVADWARGDEPIETLRADLLAATRGAVGGDEALLVPPQHGDVFLSMGIGYSGAYTATMREGGLVIVDAETAGDINAIFQQPAFSTGGNPRASRGLRAMADGIVDPAAYYPGEGRHVTETGIPRTTQEPYVKVMNRASIPKGAPGDDPVDALEAVMVAAEDLSKTEFYVPRAVRDTFQKYTDAAVATKGLSNQLGSTEGLLSFWKQATILGVGLSNPGQGCLDHFGDLTQIGTKNPWIAAKTAGRSTASQLLHTQGVAQMVAAIDHFRGADPGAGALALDRWLSTPFGNRQVQMVLDASDDIVGKTGLTGKQISRIMREEGVYENIISGQVTRTGNTFVKVQTPKAVRTVAGALQGAGAGAVIGGPLGAVAGGLAGAILGAGGQGKWWAANQDALITLANAAANRRRAAAAIGFMEAGQSAQQAARSTVKVSANFAGEMSPLTRKYIASWYPFFAYRKFNTRRAMQALANPYWMKNLRVTGEKGSLIANAYLDSDDEYGFHQGPMVLEPDPILFDALMSDLRKLNPTWPVDKVYRVAIEQSKDMPRASEKYAEIKARLDAMPYDEALRYILSGQDAEVDAFRGPYWAPDPIKAGLPAWARDRYAIYLDKARSQTLQSYYYGGSGRYGKNGDEQRYWLAPPDPNIDGITTALLFGALLYSGVDAVTGGNLPGKVGAAAGEDLLGIVSRDPTVGLMLQVAGMVNPDDVMDTPIPSSVGQNMLGTPLSSLLVIKNKANRGINPSDPDFDPREVSYYIDGAQNAKLYLLPMATQGMLASLEISRTALALQGGEGFKGPEDAVDNFGAYTWFLTGNMGKVRTGSPSMQDSFDTQDADAKVEKRLKTLEKTPTALAPVTIAQQGWTNLQVIPGFDVAVRNLAKQTPERLRQITVEGRPAVELLKAELLRRGADPKMLMDLDEKQVLEALAQ